MNTDRTPNANDEFLIDARNSIANPSVYEIHDITTFFPSKKSLRRDEYMRLVRHSIVGEKYTIHILNHENTLSHDDARKLAIAWFNQETRK